MFAHLLQQTVFGYRLESAGIDQDKWFFKAGDIGVIAITCHTGSIVHDGATMTQKTVEKSRFTYVGATYNCY